MNTFATIFLIVSLGYLLGRVTVRGISLGTSGILLVALVMGHFNFVVPAVAKNLGLVCFVTAVGVIAGPVFFENFRQKAIAYVVLGFLTIMLGAAICVFCIKVFGTPKALCVGLLNGALTSTPGLAAALEATGDPIASVGYGIAYPFGVLGVVLFVQVLPKLLGTNMAEEVKSLTARTVSDKPKKMFGFEVDPFGYFAFGVAAFTGALIGAVKIPLPGGAQFSLGTSGGPLLTGLLVGFLHDKGFKCFDSHKETLNAIREFGLAMFLLGAGTEAGKGFVEVVRQYGWSLFFQGALMTLLPMILLFIVAKAFFRLSTLNALGSICGGMTSTPALGTLIAVAGSDAVTTAYAATYPVALVCVVLSSQFIAVLM
ncbi:MAG: permease [Pyramidobacter sp.]|nr:permease [Pyramidobacter sp.]